MAKMAKVDELARLLIEQRKAVTEFHAVKHRRIHLQNDLLGWQKAFYQAFVEHGADGCKVEAKRYALSQFELAEALIAERDARALVDCAERKINEFESENTIGQAALYAATPE